METTRHFTATVYVAVDGAVALHEHDRLGILVPPGGHVDRDELPHEAALRECREETGLDATLLPADDTTLPAFPAGRALPQPRSQVLYDVDAVEGEVVHQHVDHVYFATATTQEIDPEPGEAPADAWTWYDPAGLDGAAVDPDVEAFGRDAIAAARDRAD
jgi:8-oxo-dGTP pyrophosphatase MutT (NUDIX family)